jgi:hypothetical protein
LYWERRRAFIVVVEPRRIRVYRSDLLAFTVHSIGNASHQNIFTSSLAESIMGEHPK